MYVKFAFFGDTAERVSPRYPLEYLPTGPAGVPSQYLKLGFEQTVDITVTAELLEYIQHSALHVDLFASHDEPGEWPTPASDGADAGVSFSDEEEEKEEEGCAAQAEQVGEPSPGGTTRDWLGNKTGGVTVSISKRPSPPVGEEVCAGPRRPTPPYTHRRPSSPSGGSGSGGGGGGGGGGNGAGADSPHGGADSPHSAASSATVAALRREVAQHKAEADRFRRFLAEADACHARAFAEWSAKPGAVAASDSHKDKDAEMGEARGSGSDKKLSSGGRGPGPSPVPARPAAAVAAALPLPAAGSPASSQSVLQSAEKTSPLGRSSVRPNNRKTWAGLSDLATSLVYRKRAPGAPVDRVDSDSAAPS